MLDIISVHHKEYELDNGRQPSIKARALAVNEPADSGIKEVVTAQAPGRIHFLGEHGYAGKGLYLSAAIDKIIKVAVSQRRDNSLRFFSASLGERKRATIGNLKYKREDRWGNYLKIALYVMVEKGYPLRGHNFTIYGDIPQNIALASSTALEVAAAVALRSLYRAKISDLDLAKSLARTHEMFYEKKPLLADYIVAFKAKADHFLIFDEFTETDVLIKSPFSSWKILLVDSKVPRLWVENEFENRAEQVLSALAMLSRGRKDAAGTKKGAIEREITLRDFMEEDLLENIGNLPEELRRRALHVIGEIRRVNEAKDLLARADLQEFAQRIFQSHESLRDLYEISCPEIDWLVKRAQEIVGVYGARMSGKGFGGSTFTIIRNEKVAEFREKLDDYERIFGFIPIIHEVKISGGLKVSKESIKK